MDMRSVGRVLPALPLLTLAIVAAPLASAAHEIPYDSASDDCRWADAASMPVSLCDVAQHGAVQVVDCADAFSCVLDVHVDASGQGPPGFSTLRFEVAVDGAASTMCEESVVGSGPNQCILFVFAIVPVKAGSCATVELRSTLTADLVLEAQTADGFELCRADNGTPTLEPVA